MAFLIGVMTALLEVKAMLRRLDGFYRVIYHGAWLTAEFRWEQNKTDHWKLPDGKQIATAYLSVIGDKVDAPTSGGV